MTCPSCHAQTPLTWGRYFGSPMGHTCPTCQKRFRFPLTVRHFSMLAGAGLIVGAGPGFVAWLLAGSIWCGILVGWLCSLVAILPLDRWLDDHRSQGQVISLDKS